MAESANAREEKNRLKWERIVRNGIENTIREQPEAFLRRTRRGIPDEYRYVDLNALIIHAIVLDGKFGKPA